MYLLIWLGLRIRSDGYGSTLDLMGFKTVRSALRSVCFEIFVHIVSIFVYTDLKAF